MRSPSDRGAAALEFALVLPILLVIVFGLIDFGRMLNAQLIVSDAAREGARAAAVVDEATGLARIDGITGSIGTVTRTVRACPPNPGPTDFAEADVEVNFTFVTPLGVIMGDSGEPLHAHSEMQCQR